MVSVREEICEGCGAELLVEELDPRGYCESWARNVDEEWPRRGYKPDEWAVRGKLRGSDGIVK